MFKKFCKILNHLKVVSFQEGIIEKGSPRTAPATSCSRLKMTCNQLNAENCETNYKNYNIINLSNNEIPHVTSLIHAKKEQGFILLKFSLLFPL